MKFPKSAMVPAIRRLFRGRGVRECLDVLAVTRKQLLETSRQVEESVVTVCGNFTGIAARARGAVAESATMFDGQKDGEGATVESSIETSRRTIGTLLERMERATRLSSTAVASMEEVSRTVTGIEDLLAQVQRISFTNKLVALNAKIEAVHVGDLGAGFEVVADEISRQAERSTELAGGIESHIQEMRGRVNSTAAELRQFLAEDRKGLEQSRTEAESALSMLLALHGRTRDLLTRNTEENARLAGDIAAAVIGLQFQDRVKQRVEHVVEALEKVECALAGECPGGGDAGGASLNLIAGLQSSYTMQSERDAHNLTANRSGAPEVESTGMEVELF